MWGYDIERLETTHLNDSTMPNKQRIALKND